MSDASGLPAVGFAEATRTWARIGLLSFGGPAGQIALMHRVIVEEKRWLDEARFLHALNYCMLLPGPEAQQLAIYVGWLLHGTRGGIVAGTLFVLPGFCVIVALAACYASFQASPLLAALFFGLKAAVFAVVVEAVLRIGRRALRSPTAWLLAGAAFAAIFAFGVPFPAIVLAAGLFGYAAAERRPHWFPAAGHGGAATAALPRQVEPTWRRAVAVLLVGGLLWGGPILLLWLLAPETIYPGMAGFFSKLAVVTFGGAYAVLAYVAQEAVAGLGWLRPGEMLDGLAMAETTPGPLIMVLVYVGFLAAFRTPAPLDGLAAGLAGATLTTWVTFVPCFIWIFLGAPYVERLRGDRRLAAALSAITGAVVGVVLNLALWFALHVLFGRLETWSAGPLRLPLPDVASLDLAAALLAGGALLATLRWRLGMAWTLAGCGAAGLCWKLLA